MTNYWFTSDTHFGHRNIIQYCGRPFVLTDPSKCVVCGGRLDWQDRDGRGCVHPDVDLMDEEMVVRWNQQVRPEDVVIHAGDLYLGPIERARRYVTRLNGTKFLIKGNHDQATNTVYRSLGFDPRKADHLMLDGMRIRVIHDPKRVGDLASYDLALVGHVHGAWRERVQSGKRVINVGVDVRGFRPVSLTELVGDLWNA